MNQYEGMFLFDSTFAGDFAKVEEEINRIMTRARGEIVLLRKWDERKLAYDIKKRKRGCYVLVYFKAPAESITGLERDARLSEQVLRLLVVRVEGLSQAKMEQWAARQATGDEEFDIDEDDRGGRPPRRPMGRREHAPAGARERDGGEGVDAVASMDG
ncbi:MAG: 30S ribosomal protein S6 [Phycisphaerales bacterium]|nr:30S ribosomal protein S6 [Phycisphaerales bacterium]